MKRKFSFNLPPIKVPLRSESHGKYTNPTSSHRRHVSNDSVSPLSSPYISRRPLDVTTERELRAACKLILQNFKPSDADFADQDPKLDFSGPYKRKEHRTEQSQPSHVAREVRVHRPTGAPQDMKSIHDAKNHPRKVDYSVKAYPDLPMLANSGRRREGRTAEKEAEMGRLVKTPTHDAARAAHMRSEIDSDDAKSLETPLTASTDTHINSHSTAPTSVASHRASRQYESAAAAADAQAAEWMRQELEKRRQREASSNPQVEQAQSSHRPPSRSGSIRAGIKDYIFPGARNLTRSQSRDSIQTANSQASGQLRRGGSVTGWRSWGLSRMTSSRSNSRPGTSSGRMERQEQERKAELDLNRKLPPLPSLDTWEDTETRDKEKRQSQVPAAHIANMMRTQDQQQQDYAAAVRKHHRKSGSDTMALRYANAHAQTSSSRIASPVQSSFSHKPVMASMDHSMDFDHMMSAMSSSRNLDEHLKLNAGSHAPQRSTSSVSRSPSTKVGSDGRLHAPNFSRKISAEVPRPPQTATTTVTATVTTPDTEYVRAVHVSGPRKEDHKEEQKRSLRKVLGGWMSKKEKKEDWMGQFEKKGIKNGVMTQDEAALPPVVRY
ncbi:hypothetical protein CC80DRAFT_201914 [Byssothecium circinans]|uniref:Uncharacterized protein n=1 Tax=Byssothecium circinans TaxID=147558 RepID=A0A6A5UAT1_9PLEO|nr:hypothetical protein CC80DRAFT_201914 [Byssothecium circinans]